MTEFLTRKQVARMLQARGLPGTEKSLAKWALTGEGPAFHKFGSRWVRYTQTDVDAWVEGRLSQLLTSTSDIGRS